MSLAKFAAAELDRRRAQASQLVAQNKWRRDDAEAKVLPWLHVALLAGSSLDGIVDRTDHLPVSAGDKTNALLALARARDAEVDRVTDTPPSDPAKAKALVERARQLAKLALHLGAPPYLPPEQRKAA